MHPRQMTSYHIIILSVTWGIWIPKEPVPESLMDTREAEPLALGGTGAFPHLSEDQKADDVQGIAIVLRGWERLLYSRLSWWHPLSLCCSHPSKAVREGDRMGPEWNRGLSNKGLLMKVQH